MSAAAVIIAVSVCITAVSMAVLLRPGHPPPRREVLVVFEDNTGLGDAIAGCEAEQLRAGIEQLVVDHDDVPAHELQELLDRTDARDSLAWLVISQGGVAP